MRNIGKEKAFKLTFYVCTFSLAMTIFFLSILIITIFSSYRKDPSGGEIDVLHEYQYLEVNSHSNESSVGFVKSFASLGKDEFITYQANDNHVLITNFGSDEYECHGSCFCGERRTVSLPLSKGLVFFLTAISSYLVFDRARKHFQEKCEEEVSKSGSSCPSTSVRSEVDECYLLSSSDDEIEEVKVKEQPETDIKERKKKIKYYHCKGRCVPKKFKAEARSKFAKEIGCHNLEKEGTVIDDFSKYPNNHNIYARSIFQRDFMTQYCKDQSRRVVEEVSTGYFTVVNYCVGANKGVNPSIKCKILKDVEKIQKKTMKNPLRYYD